MKNKIFNKMKEYGWNLEDFNNAYDRHYESIDTWYEYVSGEDYDFTMQDISKSKFESMIDFMSDFLRAINDLEQEKSNDIKERLASKVVDYLTTDKEIINKTINYLIQEKQRLNEEIDDIIYSDMGYVLKEKELKEINDIKKEIQYIYELIGRFEMREMELSE